MSNSSKTEYCAECWLLQYKVWAQHDEKYLLSLSYWRSSGIMSYYLLYSGSNYLTILIKYCTPQQNLNFDKNQLQYIKIIESIHYSTVNFSRTLNTLIINFLDSIDLFSQRLAIVFPLVLMAHLWLCSLFVVDLWFVWVFSPVLITLSFSIKGPLLALLFCFRIILIINQQTKQPETRIYQSQTCIPSSHLGSAFIG